MKLRGRFWAYLFLFTAIGVVVLVRDYTARWWRTQDPDEPLILIVAGTGCGWVSCKGDVLVEPVYESFSPQRGMFVGSGKDNVQHWFDPLGRTVSRYEGMFTAHPKSSVAFFVRDGKWGGIDRNCRVAFPPLWEDLSEFDEFGRALASFGGQKGCIDLHGGILIPFEWDEIGAPDSRGWARVRRGFSWGWFAIGGDLTLPLTWDDAGDFSDPVNLAPVARNGRWGAVDRAGRLVLPLQWDQLRSFDAKDMAVFKRGGRYGLIDRAGREVVPAIWDEIGPFDRREMSLVKRKDKCGWINRQGREVLPVVWQDAKPFDQFGRAAVRRGGRWGWIDRTGRELTPLEWDEVDPSSVHGMYRVKRFGGRGAVDHSGRVCIPCEWEKLEPDGRGWWRASRTLNEHVLDSTGRSQIGGWSSLWPRERTVVAEQRTHPLLRFDGIRWMLEKLKIADKPPFSRLMMSYDKDLNLIWRSDVYYFRPILPWVAGALAVLSLFSCWRWRVAVRGWKAKYAASGPLAGKG